VWKTKKMAKFHKMAKHVFYNQRFKKMAEIFKIGHEMVNLATLLHTLWANTATTWHISFSPKKGSHWYLSTCFYHKKLDLAPEKSEKAR